MTTTATAMPNTVELVHRMHRVARTVVLALERAEYRAADPKTKTEGTDAAAAVAMAMWEQITGLDDTVAAIQYARRVATPGWPSDYLSAS